MRNVGKERLPQIVVFIVNIILVLLIDLVSFAFLLSHRELLYLFFGVVIGIFNLALLTACSILDIFSIRKNILLIMIDVVLLIPFVVPSLVHSRECELYIFFHIIISLIGSLLGFIITLVKVQQSRLSKR